MQKETSKIKPKDAIAHYMSEFAKIYSGHEDFALLVFRRIIGYVIGVRFNEKPIGSYMSVGPSGSGKSYFYSCIAEVIHGKPESYLKISGEEYQLSHEIAKLTGSPAGFTGHKETEPVISRKRMDLKRGDSQLQVNLILVDEIDKAHDSLHTLMLGALDNGYMHMGAGNDVDLRDCLFCFTANSASDIYDNKRIGIDRSPLNRNVDIRDVLRKEMSNPFLGRIDKFRMFAGYTPEERRSALVLQSKRTLDGFGLHASGINIDSSFYDAIMQVKDNKHFGLRDLVRKMNDVLHECCLDIAIGVSKDKRVTKDNWEAYIDGEKRIVERIRQVL